MKVMTVANSNIDELVQVNNEQVVTDSRRVAEVFEKEHRNVTATIREILAAENSAARFFHEITYENRGKQYPCYLMNRDGFSLLVMGFNCLLIILRFLSSQFLRNCLNFTGWTRKCQRGDAIPFRLQNSKP